MTTEAKLEERIDQLSRERDAWCERAAAEGAAADDLHLQLAAAQQRARAQLEIVKRRLEEREERVAQLERERAQLEGWYLSARGMAEEAQARLIAIQGLCMDALIGSPSSARVFRDRALAIARGEERP